MDIKKVLKSLGIESLSYGASIGDQWIKTRGEKIASYSPVDGQMIGEVVIATSRDYNQCIEAGLKAFSYWKMTPAPQRGEIVRQFGEALRQKKEALGALVSYEMGKSFQEGLGEVQEMIDICDFAVGFI